jgi:hypothetical protein
MATSTWGAYFSVISLVLLLLSLVAFSDNLFTNVGQPSNRNNRGQTPIVLLLPFRSVPN